MRVKRAIGIVILLVLTVVVVIVPRLPIITNTLERELLKELKEATGMEFKIKGISLSLLPLFAQANEIVGSTKDGQLVLKVKKTKAYIGLTGLVNKEIHINRLLFRELEVTGQRSATEEVLENLKTHLAKPKQIPLELVLKSIEIEGGIIKLQDRENTLTINGIHTVLQPEKLARLTLADLSLRGDSIKDLSVSVQADLKLDKDTIVLNNSVISLKDSRIDLSGEFDKQKSQGIFEIHAKILLDGLKRVFGLTKEGTGWIQTIGKLQLEPNRPFVEALYVDLKVEGEFFLETLMELLKVTEPLKGFVNTKGTVKGPLRELVANGVAELKKGSLFRVDIDRLSCDVYYSDGKMRFTKGKATLYKGSATAEVMIALPVVNHFEIDVIVQDISSKGFFGLIGWDPGIVEGRVSGTLTSKGSQFNPSGRFVYRNEKEGIGILGNIRQVNSSYNLHSGILELTDMDIRSRFSSIHTTGTVDLNQGSISLTGTGRTEEIKELTSPYFYALSGIADFEFGLSGRLKDPVIDMRFYSNNAKFNAYNLNQEGPFSDSNVSIEKAKGSLVYRRDLLELRNLTLLTDLGQISTTGRVFFKEARHLFDLRYPVYDLNIQVEQGDVFRLSKVFKQAPSMAGLLSANFHLGGGAHSIKATGQLSASRFGIEGYQFGDRMNASFSYRDRKFLFPSMTAQFKDETLLVQGTLSLDGEFTLKAQSSSLSLSDTNQDLRKYIEGIGLKNLKLSGDGTLDNPKLDMESEVQFSVKGQRYKVRGDLRLSMRDRVITLASRLFDNKMVIAGEISIENNRDWRLTADLKTARYDFLIHNFLKEVPEDLVLNLSGRINAWGDRNTINGTVSFDRIYLYLYGNGFSNREHVNISIHKNNLMLKNLVLFNDDSELTVGGSLTIAEHFDVLFEGKSSLQPIKAFMPSLESLKGDARFVVSVTGNWKEPKINGGIEITKGSVGLKGLYYQLTSVSAYVYFDEDRLVISDAKGKFAGGDLSIRGNVYLKGFKVDRFFTELSIVNATISPTKDLWVNFKGDMLFRGDQKNQQILGDLKINKGRYTERIEWKSWLLGASKIEKTKVDYGRFNNITLNVRVTGGSIDIDNNLARSTVALDLLLRGTLNNPIPIGKVEAKEGTVFFRNNEFKVIKANLDFANPDQVKPYFNIVADTKVQNYNIRLALEGFTDQFNLSLSSDPYLSETDIFALLAVGHTGKQIKGMEAGVGAAEAAAFLTGKMQDVLEERAKSITGFDRIQIEPVVSKTTSTVSPRITVSKRLIDDRFFVTYSTSIASGEEQVWKIEYQLDKKTSIVGVRDEKGALGVDVRFRFQFR